MHLGAFHMLRPYDSHGHGHSHSYGYGNGYEPGMVHLRKTEALERKNISYLGS